MLCVTERASSTGRFPASLLSRNVGGTVAGIGMGSKITLSVALIFATGVWVHRAALAPVPNTHVTTGQSWAGAMPVIRDGLPTLLLFVDSACRGCNQSSAFYQHLSSAKPFPAHIIVFSLENHETTLARLAAWNVQPNGLVTVSRAGWVIHTPTLVLLNSEARVVFVTETALRDSEYLAITGHLRQLVAHTGGRT